MYFSGTLSATSEGPASPAPSERRQTSLKKTLAWVIGTAGTRKTCFLAFKPLVLFCRESEDTALLLLKEIYKSMGIHPEQIAH